MILRMWHLLSELCIIDEEFSKCFFIELSIRISINCWITLKPATKGRVLNMSDWDLCSEGSFITNDRARCSIYESAQINNIKTCSNTQKQVHPSRFCKYFIIFFIESSLEVHRLPLESSSTP